MNRKSPKAPCAEAPIDCDQSKPRVAGFEADATEVTKARSTKRELSDVQLFEEFVAIVARFGSKPEGSTSTDAPATGES
jgi:hypothetical protein